LNTRPVVSIFYRKPLDVIYKQLELDIMVIRPVKDYGELVKVALRKKGVSGLRVLGVTGFCGPCVCLGIFLLL
jgi:hypothetical protein